jgi:ribosomal protein S18 acetylase RimI-like enzyme
MSGNFSIHPASPGDLTTVASLFREYADALGIDLSYQGFEAELAALPGAYGPPDGALLLASSPDGDALGCVAVRALPEEPHTCEMKRLHTRPNARRSGVGRALALAAIETARQAGYQTMRLDTLPGMAAAQALYRSLGFQTTPAYYDTPIAGTIFMRKPLTRP